MSSPTEWSTVCIKEVCESIVDCVNKTAPTVDYETLYKMIRTSNVKDGWINLNEVKFVDAEVFAKWNRRTTPRKGDVILTREAPLGEVGMLRDNDSVFLGQRLVLYRADPQKLDNRFLLYSLRSDFLQGQIRAFGSGATVEHMRVPDAEKLLLRLPPLRMQKRIGDILGAYDDLIENNTRRIKILEEMAQMVYREWFVNFRFPGHEKIKMVKSQVGSIPEQWTAKPLRDLTTLISRGISPIYDDQESCVVINQKCIRNGRLCLDEARRQSKIVPEEKLVRLGDILINSTGVGTLGRVAQVLESIPNCTVDSHVSIVRPKSSTEFLGKALLYMEDHFAHLGVGSTGQTELGRERIGDTLVIAPPDFLQERFGKIVKPINQMLVCCSRQIANLRETRDLLLPKLISGQVGVEHLESKTASQIS